MKKKIERVHLQLWGILVFFYKHYSEEVYNPYTNPIMAWIYSDVRCQPYYLEHTDRYFCTDDGVFTCVSKYPSYIYNDDNNDNDDDDDDDDNNDVKDKNDEIDNNYDDDKE